MRRTLLLFLGWALVVLGALELTDGLLAGVLMLLVGLYLLSFEQPWMREQRSRLEAKFPDAARQLHALEAKARGLYRKATGEEPEDGGPGDRR